MKCFYSSSDVGVLSAPLQDEWAVRPDQKQRGSICYGACDLCPGAVRTYRRKDRWVHENKSKTFRLSWFNPRRLKLQNSQLVQIQFAVRHAVNVEIKYDLLLWCYVHQRFSPTLHFQLSAVGNKNDLKWVSHKKHLGKKLKTKKDRAVINSNNVCSFLFNHLKVLHRVGLQFDVKLY